MFKTVVLFLSYKKSLRSTRLKLIVYELTHYINFERLSWAIKVLKSTVKYNDSNMILSVGRENFDEHWLGVDCLYVFC